MRYAVVLEQGDDNWGAYSPDVPGCVSTGETAEEALHAFQEALSLHIEGLREEGLPVPEPRSRVDHVTV